MAKIVRTKVNKDADSVETNVTIDWAGVTEEECQKLASATLIIDQQAIWRTSGVIPTGDYTLKARELLDAPKGAGGFKPTPENMAARMLKMPDAEYASALELLGLDKKAIANMLKQRTLAQQ